MGHPAGSVEYEDEKQEKKVEEDCAGDPYRKPSYEAKRPGSQPEDCPAQKGELGGDSPGALLPGCGAGLIEVDGHGRERHGGSVGEGQQSAQNVVCIERLRAVKVRFLRRQGQGPLRIQLQRKIHGEVRRPRSSLLQREAKDGAEVGFPGAERPDQVSS